MRSVALVLLIALAIVGVRSLLDSTSARPRHDAPERPAPSVTTAPPSPTSSSLNGSTAATAAVVPRIAAKYRYLLEDIDSNTPEFKRLTYLLHVRESIEARAGSDHERSDPREVLDVDGEIRSLLGAARYETYAALRDSDVEQKSLDDFSGGIETAAALDDSQRRELLFAKLRHKQQFETWQKDSGFDRRTLSLEERNYAHATLERALRDYYQAYLRDVRPYLDDEQFERLRSYEETELRIALQRMQQTINER